MELKIISNTDNKLLSRKEISFSVEQSGSTVTRAEVSKELCKKLNLNPDGMVIVRIDQSFGTRESRGLAHSYENKQTLERYESKKLSGKGTKKPKAGAAPKEEPKKEESKPEEKKE